MSAHSNSGRDSAAGLAMTDPDELRHVGPKTMPDPDELDRDSAVGLATVFTSVAASAQFQHTTLGALLVQTEDRPALLNRLKLLGVASLADRQQMVNALSKLRRGGERQPIAPAAALPIRHAPLLLAAGVPSAADDAWMSQHPCGTHGLLIHADGSASHVNGQPPARVDNGTHAWITHGTRLDGPVVAEVARLAVELGRPCFLPFCDEDPGIAAPHCSYTLDPAAAPPRRDAWLRAAEKEFGPRVLVLCTAILRGAPSHPMVRLMPCFDSWIAGTTELPSSSAVAVPFAQRRDQAVWRGVNSGSRAVVSGGEALRSRLLRYCEGRPWADCAFGGGMSWGEQWLTLDEQCTYKVILAVDGNAWASAWEWAPASGSVIVSIGVWHHAATALYEAGTHYLVAQPDLSDLEEVVTWVFEHPEAAATMAKRAQEAYAHIATPRQTCRAIVHALTPGTPMETILHDLKLPHLARTLADECPRGLAELCSADRTALLRRLQRLGVDSLAERQALANGLLRELRAGRLHALASRRPRIAFLLLTYAGLPHEALWRSFFEPADPTLYGVFVHQKVAEPLKHFAGCAIPTVPTEYGKFGIVEAELALLKAALADSRGFSKFVLCSGACVPVKPFAHVHTVLTRDDLAHFAEFSAPYGRYAGRLTPLAGILPITCAAKHSQWWVLNRRVGSLVLDQSAEYMALWRETEVPDEHYFLSTIRLRHVESADDFWDPTATPDDVACYAGSEEDDFEFPHWVCWSRAKRPAPESTAKGAIVDWNGEPPLRPHVCDDIAPLVASPALFGRKVQPSPTLDKELRAVYSADRASWPKSWAAPSPMVHAVL